MKYLQWYHDKNEQCQKKEEDVSKIFDAALEKFMFLGKGSLRRVKPSERKVSAMCANSEQGDLLAGGG